MHGKGQHTQALNLPWALSGNPQDQERCSVQKVQEARILSNSSAPCSVPQLLVLFLVLRPASYLLRAMEKLPGTFSLGHRSSASCKMRNKRDLALLFSLPVCVLLYLISNRIVATSRSPPSPSGHHRCSHHRSRIFISLSVGLSFYCIRQALMYKGHSKLSS